MKEARNSGGTVTAQYFAMGETISGSNYFYTKDKLGSTREMTDSSGNIQAEYSYDFYGRVTKTQGSLASDFQYAGYYFHAPSGLNLTLSRAYNASLGRFINRDDIGERGGINLYGYVHNDPASSVDPSGMKCDPCKKPPVLKPRGPALYDNGPYRPNTPWLPPDLGPPLYDWGGGVTSPNPPPVAPPGAEQPDPPPSDWMKNDGFWGDVPPWTREYYRYDNPFASTDNNPMHVAPGDMPDLPIVPVWIPDPNGGHWIWCPR
jgi:RHS repeat-associated protein